MRLRTLAENTPYIVSVGVNANESGWDLTLAAPSAHLAANLWTARFARKYEVVTVALTSDVTENGVILTKPSATKTNERAVLDILAGRESIVSADIRKAIDPEGQLRRATPDDAVVLYIGSHGYADPNGRFYVIPYDTGARRGITENLLNKCQANASSTSCSAARDFLASSISSDDFAAWWQGVDAGEMVMVLDSCHSAAVPGHGFRPGPLGDPGFGQLSYDKGMRILAAAQPDSMARATNLARLGHTLLTEALQATSTVGANESIADWLQAAAQQVSHTARLLYPELKDDELQLPELMDFAAEMRSETNATVP